MTATANPQYTEVETGPSCDRYIPGQRAAGVYRHISENPGGAVGQTAIVNGDVAIVVAGAAERGARVDDNRSAACSAVTGPRAARRIVHQQRTAVDRRATRVVVVIRK